MADVTGSIKDSTGTKDVQLNNAATEATLKLLLQSSLAANKQSLASIQKLAQQSGINPAIVAAANTGMQQAAATGSKLGTGFEALGFAAGYVSKAFNEAADLTKKLASGSAEASDVFESFSKVGGTIGLVFGGMAKLAIAQEAYLKTYQDLSSSGINFSGSLTNMRMAAASTYMTLDGFSKLMKNNSEAFAKMGGTADEGAQAFVKVANQMQKSEIGDQLRALGYTSEQANEGLASYIAMSGGRNKTEMQQTQKLAAAAGEYMTQLDALAQVTGKSREAQENALKEQAANQAYQAYLLTLDEEGKAKANAALANAMATGGKGAADALQSSLLGLPPMTKAAQEYTGMFANSAKATQESANAVKDSTKTVADINRIGAKQQIAATQDIERMGMAASSLVMSGNETIGAAMGMSNRNKQQGIKTEADAMKQREEIAAKQKERVASEAASAAEAKKSLNELGQQIINRLMPIFAGLIGYVNKITIVFADFAKYLLESPKLLASLGVAVVGITAAIIAYKVATTAAAAAETAKKLSAGFGKGGGVKGALAALGPLGSRANPMYVIALGGGLGGGPGGKGKPGATPAGKGTPGMLGAAKKFAKLGGVAGGVLGAASLYSDMGDIAEQQKRGEITAEEAKKAKGGAIGEAGGGLAGAATGAALGAALGSVVPVLGTAIGGLIGGAIGAFGGGELGKKVGERIGGSDKAPGTAEIKEGPMPMPVAFETPTKTLQTDIQTLNTTMREMLKYVKDTAEYSKRNVDATKALNGNFFPAP